MRGLPVNVLLLAHEAPDISRLQEAWESRQIVEGVLQHKFVVLGRFDQLVITCSGNGTFLIPPEMTVPNARAATSCSYTGRVVQPEDFDPGTWAKTHPMVGLCSLRLARRALAATENFDFIDDYLKHRLQSWEVRHAVISTTGWEDALVLFFARSFNAISKAVGLLRGMRIADLPLRDRVNSKDGFTHPCLTTSTLPAFCCGWRKSWLEHDTVTFLSRVSAEESLHWAVRMEVHPGHWGAFLQEIQRQCAELSLEVDVRPAFGQTDLRISSRPSSNSATHGGLLKFILHVVLPLGAAEGSVLRSAETHIHPDVPQYAEDGQAGAAVDCPRQQSGANPHEAFSARLRDKLRELAVPAHTLAVLAETFTRVQCISDDRLHGEEFATLFGLQKSFASSVLSLKAPAAEREIRELQLDISDWQMHMDRCLADRYRGPYPMGDSLMMRLGSYQGAHHRFLVVMDQLAQHAYELARNSIKEHRIKDATLATFIGNSPSPYAISHTLTRLGCGFTDLPATMVCRLHDAHLLMHETGHHILRAFFDAARELGFSPYRHDPVAGLGDGAKLLKRHALSEHEVDFLNQCWRSSTVLREINELLADYFSACICFCGDLPAHRKATELTLDGFFDGGSPGFLNSVKSDFRMRSYGIEALRQDPRSSEQRCRDSLQRGRSAVEQRASKPIPMKRFDERAELVVKAVKAVQLLLKVPGFSDLLGGFEAAAKAESFGSDAPPELLGQFRKFIQADGRGAQSASLEFLDTLWFLILRKQEEGFLVGAV